MIKNLLNDNIFISDINDVIISYLMICDICQKNTSICILKGISHHYEYKGFCEKCKPLCDDCNTMTQCTRNIKQILYEYKDDIGHGVFNDDSVNLYYYCDNHIKLCGVNKCNNKDDSMTALYFEYDLINYYECYECYITNEYTKNYKL